MTPAAKNALIGVALLGGAWGAYRFVYVPWKVKQEMLRQAAILAQQRGISQGDALKMLGSVACQGMAATYGVPPLASGGLCDEVGGLASSLTKQLPNLLVGVGAGAGQGLNLLASGVGSGVANLGIGVSSGAVAVGSIPLRIATPVVGSVYGGVKTVVEDVYGGVKSVVHDLNPLNWF